MNQYRFKAIFIVLLCITFSCKRYSEGPKIITFRSANSRLMGSWKANTTDWDYSKSSSITINCSNANILDCKRSRIRFINATFDFAEEDGADGTVTIKGDKETQDIDIPASENNCGCNYSNSKISPFDFGSIWDWSTRQKQGISLFNFYRSQQWGWWEILKLTNKEMHFRSDFGPLETTNFFLTKN